MLGWFTFIRDMETMVRVHAANVEISHRTQDFVDTKIWDQNERGHTNIKSALIMRNIRRFIFGLRVLMLAFESTRINVLNTAYSTFDHCFSIDSIIRI